MNKSVCFNGTRCRRALWIAGFLAAVCGAGVVSVAADDTSLDDSAKKVGNNFGELLKGMGQELKKAGGSLTESGKKNGTKEKKPPEPEPEKDKDNAK
ncbi:MAG: hypothetical protein OEM83_06650 [Gammaproteobacteria bacterium]|nr:hypothetical protein [Gammaproteobacteria bacterium]